jgi:hypothetical protein
VGEEVIAGDLLANVLSAFDDAVAPLEAALQNADSFAAFLRTFGWDLTDGTDPSAITGMTDLSTALTTIDNAVSALQASPSGSDAAALIEDVVQAIESLSQAIGALSAPGASPYPLNETSFWSSFPDDLVNFLFYTWVQGRAPSLYGILRALRVLTETNVPASQSGDNRAAYLRKGVNWQLLIRALSNPGAVFTDPTGYGWGTSQGLDYLDLFTGGASLLGALGAPAIVGPPPDATLQNYWASGSAGSADLLGLTVALYSALGGQASWNGVLSVNLGALPIAANTTGNAPGSGTPAGIALFPSVTGTLPATPINLIPGLTLQIGGGLSAEPVSLLIIPGESLQVAGPKVSLNASVAVTAAPSSPWFLIGTDDGSSLQLAKGHAGLTINGGTSTPFEVVIAAGIDQATAVIDFSDADQFLSTVIGNQQESLQLSLALQWSSTTGLTFSGQAQLGATIAVHETLANVVTLNTVYVALGTGGGGSTAALQLAVGGSLTLGPVTVSVDKVGFELELDPSGGNLGGVDLEFGFRPPDGLGLAVDASVASGGGYIALDPAHGQYAGVFALALDLPIVTVSVYVAGVLNTQLPGGQSGYSFLMILVAQFDPGFQLGFGFELDGVGGLVGINRSVSLSALQTAFNSHSLDDIFFPSDPQAAISNVQQTISDLATIFPITPGQTVFGPMLSLAWGTPQIVTADFGGVLQVPDLRLALFGLFTVGLPTVEEPDLALVLLHIDILGEIDFDQDLLSITGTLYDSHVVMFSLSGQFALILNWGSQPEFALSIGGLNPQFQPPPNFPTLQRLVVSLGSGSVSLSLSSYFAVTSNTVQVGADLELHASAGGFSVHGYLGFDAFFIFSPFSFTVDMRAGIDVLQGSSVLLGINLDLTLSGPNPWHAHGDASFTILFFSVGASVDVTIGSGSQAQPLPATDVWPLLQAAWEDPSNWTASLPGGIASPVSFAPAPAGDQVIVVHPMGQLTVHEKVVPLDFTISQFGSAAPGDYVAFSVATPTLNGQPANAAPPLQDYFAPAQFETLSDGDKLSKPSYQLLDAILTIGSNAIACDASPKGLDVHYATYYVVDPTVPAAPSTLPTYRPAQPTQLALAGQGAAAASPARATGKDKYLAPGTSSPISTSDVSYVIASTTTMQNQPSVSSASPWPSQTAAEAALAAFLADNPQAAGILQVVPEYEAA